MLPQNTSFAVHPASNRTGGDARERVLDVLCRRYVRETQHVIRFRQHAERITDDEIRRALLDMAAREARHVLAIEENIAALGGQLPPVIDIRCGQGDTWEYLRSDFDDERRCIGEINEEKVRIGTEFPQIIALLDRIESDAQKHREEIRRLFSKKTPPLLAA